MSLMTDLQAAVVARINGGTYSEAVTATAVYFPTYKLEDLATLKVTVAPNDDEETIESRSATIDELSVAVGIQKKLEGTGETGVADLDTLTEAIRARLTLHSFDSVGARFFRVSRRPYVAWDKFESDRVFQAFVVVTYKVRRG